MYTMTRLRVLSPLRRRGSSLYRSFGMMSPLLCHGRIHLKRNGESSQQQRSAIDHGEFRRKVHDPVHFMQFAMPGMIHVMRLKWTKHEARKLGQEVCRIILGLNLERSECVGDLFIVLVVGDAEYQGCETELFIRYQSFALSEINQTKLLPLLFPGFR